MKTLPGLAEHEMEAWLAFLKAHAHIVALLDRELIGEHGLSLAEYEVLAFLSRAPGGRMRMSDLAERVLISPGALTRRVDGLERKRLVSRTRHSDDSRVVYATLTNVGAETLSALTPTHVTGIRQHFADLLSPEELKQIGEALWKVAGSCDQCVSKKPH
jgi:DNA-binding MarR family transcriptional regulator